LDAGTWLIPTITGIVGGGLATAITTFVRGFSEARKIDTETQSARAKLPHEVDSMAVQTAEQALEMQRTVNASLVQEIERRDEEISRKDEEIARKDEEIAVLHAAVASRDQTIGQIRSDLAEANRFGHEMLRKLADANERYADLVRLTGDTPGSPDLV
jgi:predicted RNase H-like nuclease (RuvC/YqgF family)